MNIGDKIIELRKKHKLTQEKLAEKIGVSRQTLSNWESNITSPNLEQAKILSKQLYISLDELADNELDIVCSDNLKNNILKKLIGKICYFDLNDNYLDSLKTKVLDVNDDFIKIEYLKNKTKQIKLIDIDLIISIKVVEEE